MNIYSVFRLPFTDQMLCIPSVNIENISHMARTALQSSAFEHIGHGATDFSLTVITNSNHCDDFLKFYMFFSSQKTYDME
jgi:hypothetical protein